MPVAEVDDGTGLYFEEAGAGQPILFVHEFADDFRGWAPQVAHFAGMYRCIVYNARGYPPSDVPESPSSYSQDRAVADAVAVLDHLGIGKAHIVGNSMGGFCALHLGLQHPARTRSLVIAGCGYGAAPGKREQFKAEARVTAQALLDDGMAATAERYCRGPTRVMGRI